MSRRPSFVVAGFMMGHCAYVWKKSNPDGKDTVMYVGVSTTGIRRFGNHHVLPINYADDDYVEVYPCRSRLEAVNLEHELATTLAPMLNKMKTRSVTADELQIRYAKRRIRKK